MDKAPTHFLSGPWAASTSHIGAAASSLFLRRRPSLNVVKQASQGWGREGEWILVEGVRKMGIVESDQGILAQRFCDYSPAVQLKAGLSTLSGDRALVQALRTDHSGVIANGKPPPILQAGTLLLTQLIMACSPCHVHESLESKVLYCSLGPSREPKLQ